MNKIITGKNIQYVSFSAEQLFQSVVFECLSENETTQGRLVKQPRKELRMQPTVCYLRHLKYKILNRRKYTLISRVDFK